MDNTVGTYVLSYKSDPFADQPVNIRLSITEDADLTQMCRFFDSFLKAAGYIYSGEVKIA